MCSHGLWELGRGESIELAKAVISGLVFKEDNGVEVWGGCFGLHWEEGRSFIRNKGDVIAYCLSTKSS